MVLRRRGGIERMVAPQTQRSAIGVWTRAERERRTTMRSIFMLQPNACRDLSRSGRLGLGALFAALLGAACAAQQTAPSKPANDANAASQQAVETSATTQRAPETVDEAKAALKTAEAEHPGNTREVAEALNALLQLEVEAVQANDQLLSEAKRGTAIAEAAAGKESDLYVEAVVVEAWVYMKMDRPDLARPIAEDALVVAQNVGKPDPLADAASALANICANIFDDPCYLQYSELEVKAARSSKDMLPIDVASHLLGLLESRRRMKDKDGAKATMEEILAIAAKEDEKHNETGQRWASVEDDAGAFYITSGTYDIAIPHLKKSIELFDKADGPDNLAKTVAVSNLAYAEMCASRIEESEKYYAQARELYMKRYGASHTNTAYLESGYASMLNFVGRYQDAADMALTAHRKIREHVRTAIRLLPERQALALANTGEVSYNVALSVAVLHPEIKIADVYQEVARSRAQVAEEMAQREAALSRKPDPQTEALEKEMETERRAVMDLEGGAGSAQALRDATEKMERTERELATRSTRFRTGERMRSSDLADLRANMPKDSVLVSYVRFTEYQMEKTRFHAKWVQSYAAFTLHPDGEHGGPEQVHIFNLGEAKAIDDLIERMRNSADAEAHGGGLGSARNEREYRAAGEQLRKLVWDPLAGEMSGAGMVLVVPDGVLNLVPFSALPQGPGYLVEHGPVVHVLTTERDLIPAETPAKKAGLMAVGGPAFELAEADAPSPDGSGAGGPRMGAPALRETPVTCDTFSKMEFNPLPASLTEVNEISSTWKRWNAREPEELLTGDNATRAKFLEAAPRARVLHVATHAFVLDKSCGDGNPLLHSGLVFAGANKNRGSSILTAQQIASVDLTGVDWAVLSACNTGNGELRDGEGVLGLERSFRVAGAKSVVMTLWPVGDEVTREYMHELYAERFGRRASTANAAWIAARRLLRQRQAAGKSTHPWYWAGFVAAGEWR